MVSQQEIYTKEFYQCKTQKDYEAYFIKYYNSKDNPYLVKCRKIISKRSALNIGLPVFLFVWSLVVCAFMVIMNYNSSDARDSTDRLVYAIIGFVCSFPFVVGTAWWIISECKKIKRVYNYGRK